jgi:hypothetical protein
MNRHDFNQRLEPVLKRQRQRRQAGWMTASGLIAVFIGGWAVTVPSIATSPIAPWVIGLAVGQAAVCFLAGIVHSHRPFSESERASAIRKVERTFPELDGLILTAAEIPSTESISFLQQRVLRKAVEHASDHDWREAFPIRTLNAFRWGQAVLAVLVAAILLLQLRSEGWPHRRSETISSESPRLDVAPGDTEIERGQNLVVAARLGKKSSSKVELIWNRPNQPEKSIELTQSLSDPLYGGGIPAVTDDFDYRIVGAGLESRRFHVHVFEVPRLERADALLTPPPYTGQKQRRLEDTHRIAALEDSHVELTLQLNHPVKSALLVSRSNAVSNVVLSTFPDRAQATLNDFRLLTQGTYDLHLVDFEGRTNRPSPPFVFEALPNRRPEIRMTSPRGDAHPSPLEELSFSGTVWDDIGVLSYGLGLSLVGQEVRYLELGHAVAGQKKEEFHHLLEIESLHLKPGQLISWFGWADDFDRDGLKRRTLTDLYFAEIRPYDEVFREGKSPETPPGDGKAESQSSPTQKLAELQKQVLVASWALLNRVHSSLTAMPTNDLAVLRESQKEALKQATAAQQKATSPAVQKQWQSVVDPMHQAVGQLVESAGKKEALPAAITSEQSAYQALLSMAAREHEVSRSKQKNSGKGSANSNQRQLDQLDLTETDNKYENQKQAQAKASPQQKEQSQILDRLKELARRQEDVNERLKELQTALTAAKTESERDEIRRQLKHLQDDQRQLVADADDLARQMERPENQSSMSEERRRLDETRTEMQRAADAAQSGATAQSLASGTRAQQQLEEQRESLRRKTSGQVGEDLKNLRAEARELARQQTELEKKLGDAASNSGHSLDSSGLHREVLDDLARQREKLNRLVGDARQVAQLAEASEPRASQKLEDSLRRFEQNETATIKQFRQSLLQERKLTRSLDQKLEQLQNDGQAKSLSLTSELARQGLLPEAATAGSAAQSELNHLSQGIEQAAASAVGDDTEALRQAATALDRVTQALQSELAAAGATTNSPPPSSARSSQGPTPKAPGSSGPETASSTPANTAQPGESISQNPQGSPGTQPSSGRATAPGATGAATAGSRDGVAGNSSTSGNSRQPGAVGPVRSRTGLGDSGGNAGGANPLDLGYGDSARDRGNAGSNDHPITGGNFTPWANTLRDAEEMVDAPDLRNAIASAREKARQMRIEFKNHRQKPDWLKVNSQIVQPLVEVRNRLAEELARRGSQDALVPLDRDPVPARYTERVQRYYQELGKDH